jgi:ATP-binding cassette subfamily B protein
VSQQSAVSQAIKSDAKPAPPDAAAAQGGPSRALAAVLPSLDGIGNGFLLAWMFRFLRPVKPLVFMTCLWLSLWAGAEILTTKQTARVVNEIQKLRITQQAGGFWHWIWPDHFGVGRIFGTLIGRAGDFRDQTFALAFIVALYVCFRYLRVVSNTRLSMTMVFYIREAIYDKLQRVGFGFHDAISSGQLINRALSDLQNVRAFVETVVTMSTELLLITGGYIILLMTISPWIGLLSLLPLPIWTFYILRFSKVVQPAARAVMEAEDKNVSIITENIAGVHVIKAFATEQQEISKYNANCDAYLTRVLKRIRLFADFTPIIRLIAMSSHLSLFLVAGIMMVYGNMEAGSFMILGQAMGAILNRLQTIATINEQYQNAIVSARRLYEVLYAPPTVPESKAVKPLPPGPGAIRFENVSFGYDKSKPVLHDVSFEVPGGSIVAVVGPTGAGKTTLVNLIARFYDPGKGRILIDGMDVRDASLASLRTQVSFVFQETYLFSDTVSSNIAYGRPNISQGDIEAAARLAQAHEFIEQLASGYATLLGERGSSLSGGQRQRLAIARAILTNPRILILDDATAAVDPETEDLIRRGMRFVMQGRTTFIIAHRVSTVKRADLVIVLEGGRVTQMGTHDQLMQQDGHYRDIAAVQLYGEESIPEEGEHPSWMHRLRNLGAVPVPAGEDAATVEEV